jgi:hypothetical protein
MFMVTVQNQVILDDQLRAPVVVERTAPKSNGSQVA